MDVPLAVLADAANATADGRLNILGIFGEIRSSQFPAIHPAAVLAASASTSSIKESTRSTDTRVIPTCGR